MSAVIRYRGLGKPPSYVPRNRSPTLTSVGPGGPYRNVGGAPASALFTVLSGVAASFNGLQFAIDDPFALPNKIFQFYTGAPPAGPVIGINVAGLTLPSQIALVMAAAFIGAGYRIGLTGPGSSVRVTQPFPGVRGNVDIFPQAGLMTGGLLAIQTVTIAGLIPTFSGGASFAIPLRFGPVYSLGLTPLNTPLFRLGVG